MMPQKEVSEAIYQPVDPVYGSYEEATRSASLATTMRHPMSKRREKDCQAKSIRSRVTIRISSASYWL
jgi:hypothetical protein